MDKEKNTGRAVAGFFLTFITIIMLIAGGNIAALKMSVLNCSDVDEFLDNIDFYSTVQEIVVLEIKSQISDEEKENGIAGSLTEGVVDSLLTEDIVKDMTKSITNAITKDEEIDLRDVKDKCVDNVTDLSNQVVDDIFDEISSNSGVVNLDTLQNSTVLQQYQQDYNVNITSIIVDEIENEYGETSVDLEKIDIDDVKAEAKNAVVGFAIPLIEESIDTYIDKANSVVNAQVTEIKESGELKQMTAAFNILLNITNIALVILLSVAVAASLLQVFVVYGKQKNRAFRNVAIATGITSVAMMVSGITLNFLKNMISNVFGEHKSDKIIMNFVEDNISKIYGDMYVVGGIFVVIFVVFLCVSIHLKKRAEK